MILGPVFWMEMRAGARRVRHYLTRGLFVASVFVVVLLTYVESFYGGRFPGPLRPHELTELGQNIFAAYSISQFLLFLSVAPLYTAGTIAGDRERRVLELVLMTRLGNLDSSPASCLRGSCIFAGW